MIEVLDRRPSDADLAHQQRAWLVYKPLLSEQHRSQETTELVRLVVTMLMTFVALVLGLLTASAKASFDKVGNALTGVAIATIQPDRSLRQ